ncbi:helix-turn-helix domain-containing protein [Spirosoma fluviale]|uniref:AraC family transcriptional regulator, transcriptional activator of pobA n=1 Tax=Spirosoma fluviale TaxID=1597977 RepID=A0A286G498_9BACT|nr:helix-turn-helix domain-containing protein [Spirosoma fluviale]SOD90312.1 AraC family transcriptional regulator, transcriptional activator of pobA [Spirosoma fluviale]
MQRITQYDGLYGEANTRPDAEYLFSELLETRSQSFDWVIQPHIHARLFQVFFVETGQFNFQEATRTRQLTGPCLLLIPPTALHGFVYNSDVRGRILTLSDALIDTLFPGGSPVAAMLGSLQCLSIVQEPYSARRVSELIKAIHDELFDDQPEKRMMLQSCLQQFFLVVYRLWQQSEQTSAGTNNLSLHYFRKFQQRVRQVGTTHTIAQLADDLAITPVHLNRICQAVSGKSASQLVQVHILDEARKYLTYTTYSVSEIAYLLHFEYPNYFAKFFRKHTGLSPSEFREGQMKG